MHFFGEAEVAGVPRMADLIPAMGQAMMVSKKLGVT